MIKSGSSKVIKFNLSDEDFSFYTRDMSFKAEAGDFEIYIGGNSNADQMVKVTLNEF